jgi:hypothetical protein
MVQPSKELVNASGETSGRTPEQRQDGQFSRLTAQVGNNALAIVGVVTSIAEFAGLVASAQLRDFVRTYPYPICISLIVVLLALLVSLNYVQIMRRQRDELRAAAQRSREPRPSAHDTRLFTEVLTDLPFDGPVITWLRRMDAAALGPANVPADVLTALERTSRRLEGRPVGFDDDLVARALARFLAAIEDYRVNLENWTLALLGTALTSAAGGVRSTGTEPITGVFGDSQQRLLQAYDFFIVTGHEHGLDVDC